MGALVGRLIGLLIGAVLIVLILIYTYKKNQKDDENSLKRQLEILKYKHSKNMAAKSKDTPKDDTEDK